MNLEFAAEVVAKTTGLLIIALVIRATIPRNQSSLRHMVLLLSLMGSMALPFVVSTLKSRTSINVPTSIIVSSSKELAPISSNVPASPSVTQSKQVFDYPIPWDQVLFRLWLVGLSMVSLRYLAGLLAIRRLSTITFCGPVNPPFEVRIANEPSIGSAMTWGMFRPRVILPYEAHGWSDQRLQMVLVHEFAHVRRRDFASQLLAEFVCALYWFNPIAWCCARAMREDAELAADEAVVMAGFRPSDYAAELLTIAASLRQGRMLLSRAGVSNMKHSKIETRLRAILDSSTSRQDNRQNRRAFTKTQTLAVTLFACLTVSAIASLKLQDDPSNADKLRSKTLARLKSVARATLIYTSDWDDRLPFAHSTKEAETITFPYAKDHTVYRSPRKDCDFRYNTNLSGIILTSIDDIAGIPMWYETTPKDLAPGVAYLDGHVKIVTGKNREDLEKALKKTFKGGKTKGGIGGETP